MESCWHTFFGFFFSFRVGDAAVLQLLHVHLQPCGLSVVEPAAQIVEQEAMQLAVEPALSGALHLLLSPA